MTRLSFGGFLSFPQESESKKTFEEGLRIAADNKINGNNTWNLGLIDYFRDMTLLREGDSINFQKASFTLDGCVKVYTSRIDSVEIETRKLLMGLADKQEEEVVASEEATQTRKRKQNTKTLDDNENLITDQFDLDFQQDPLFQKTAADFDEGGAKGLLLAHLDISSTGKIIFDASDNMPCVPVQDENVDIDMAGLKEKFGARLATLPNTQICPTFSSFLFNSDQLQDFSIEGEDRQDYYFNQDEMSDYEDAPEYDYLNQDFNDDFGDVGQDDVNLNPEVRQRRMTMIEEKVMKMVANTTVSQDPNMYEYFDSVPNTNWAGPEFWKGRAVRSQTNTEKASKPRVTKEKEKLNFYQDLSIDQVFAKSSTSINLPKKTLHEDLHLLPVDMKYDSEKMLSLFLKPQFKIQQVVEKLAAHKPEEKQDEGDYFYGGFDDDFDDGPIEYPKFEELQNDGFVGDTVEQSVSVENVINDENQTIGHDSVIPEPEPEHPQSQEGHPDVPASQSLDLSMAGLSLEVKQEQPLITKRVKPIPLVFSRSAKRVDVSKLKENLWHKISDEAPGQEDGNTTKSNVTLLKEEKAFTEIVSELDDCYEDKARKDISIAFCFICVLHLANENNLKITGSDEMKELIISAV